MASDVNQDVAERANLVFWPEPLPVEMSQAMFRRGAMPAETESGHNYFVGRSPNGSEVVAIALEDRPAGPDGKLERRATISAMTKRVRRLPRPEEVEAALESAEMRVVDRETGKFIVWVHGTPRKR